MFETITDADKRGQVGIGTLIVFIAMVLVAAIAAGVLINTAGFLQSKSQRTGEESTQQVSDRLQVVTVTGQDIDDTAGTLGIVNVTVSQAAGADEIDLVNSTVTWIGPSGTYTLAHNSTGWNATSQKVEGSQVNADGTFNVSTIKDADSSSPVINDPDDRIQMNFDVDEITDGTKLSEGEDVTLQINTMAGATTEVRFTVPESLAGKSAVEL